MMDCGPKVLGAIMFAEESLGSYAGVKAFQTSDLKKQMNELRNKIFGRKGPVSLKFSTQ